MDANVSDGRTLELALLADGVPIDKLFPLDVERALQSLDRIGRDNILWYNTNQEPIQQLLSGAASLAAAFDGRVLLANRGGANMGFTPNCAAVSGNYYCVSGASASKHAAFELLNFMLTNIPGDARYRSQTHRIRRIGARILRASCCDDGFPQTREVPRCRQSVAPCSSYFHR